MYTWIKFVTKNVTKRRIYSNITKNKFVSDENLLSTLMKLVQEGDHKAFQTFYEFTVDQLAIYLRSQTNLEVEDLLSQIYITIWEKSRQYDPEKGSVKAWMYTMARNIMISEHRRRKEETSIYELEEILEDETQNVERDADSFLNNEKLYKALNKLKKEFKDVIIFRFLEGYSIEETSQILNISNANVRITQHRAIKELRKILEKN